MFHIDLRFYDSLGSTQEKLISLVDDAAAAGEAVNPGLAVLARTQSAGRGRLGRSFASPEGGIYLSVLLPLESSLSGRSPADRGGASGLSVGFGASDVAGRIGGCGFSGGARGCAVADGKGIFGLETSNLADGAGVSRLSDRNGAGNLAGGLDAGNLADGVGVSSFSGGFGGCGLAGGLDAGQKKPDSASLAGSAPQGGHVETSRRSPSADGVFITSKIAVAVRRAIFKETGKECGIKWVNDLYYNGGKVCGIITQVHGGFAVAGIGINFCTDISSLPPDVRERAASLYSIRAEADCSEMDVVNAILREASVLFSEGCAETDAIGGDSWLTEYKSASILIGESVTIIQAGKVVGSGTVTGIDDMCHLHVDVCGVDTVLSTGEVSIRRA